MSEVVDTSFEPSWKRHVPPAPEAYGPFAEALRAVQDLAAGAAPPDELTVELTGLLRQVATRLAEHQVDEDRQYSGALAGDPGRGQTLVPPIQVDSFDGHTVRGQVTFGRFYLGGNTTVHGGAILLLFDEVLGRLANAQGEGRSRTAYLHMDYRAVAPLYRPLRFEARLDRQEGRKCFVVGALYYEDVRCADVDALFVRLRPGQA